MKTVILAGGYGTRISEESHLRPKPMVEVGGMPLLWHIMKIYSSFGLNDFVICCGYKGYLIKEYFTNYLLHMSDVTVDLQNSTLETHRNMAEPWKVTLVDTGLNVGTARFGILSVEDGVVSDFEEKPRQENADWINSGFFVLDQSVLELIDSDDIFFEREPMERLTKDKQLAMYQHEGFWMCMDTLRDKNTLEDLWRSGDAPWKVWK